MIRNISIFNIVVWKVEEHIDLLVLYKNMLLGGIKKDNFKELSKRMSEVGWERNNDQCRQQIYILQDQFDRMNEASSKTGGCLHFEPLRYELNDCFGALKNVQPDSVFSNRQGLIVHPNASDDDNDDTETSADVSPGSTASQKKEEKRKTKSN